MNLFVGTSGYSYPAWKGSFYPAKLPAKQFLRHYGEHFRSVEVNATFRGLPKESTRNAWTAEVPAEFRFVLKSPQQITHIKRLKDVADPVAAFLAFAAPLKERLGPLLFQLPPNLKKDAPQLRDFLALVPDGTRVAFEFRHETWFDDEVYDLLRSHNAALVLTEAEGDLTVPTIATADWGYLRLRLPDYGDKELRAWLRTIRKQPWGDVYMFFKHEDEGTGPRFAQRLLELAG